MPISPPSGEASISYSVSDLVNDAAIEIGMLAPSEQLEPEVAQWGFRQCNYVLDVWAALRRYVYSYQFLVFTFPAGVNPILMGPSAVANWAVPQRPVRLESAALILNSGTAVDLPINIRDKDWWALNSVKSIQTNVPTDVYPDYTWPDASLYFWPVINAGDQCRVQVWGNISQFDQITDPIGGPGGVGTLPPAMRSALVFTVAEAMLPGANKPPNPVLTAKATAARAAFIGNNAKAPRIQTQDAGMPKAQRGTRSDFNWATGGRPGGAPQ